MPRLVTLAASFALLTGSFTGAIADDERQTPVPPLPPATDADVLAEVDEAIQKLRTSDGVLRNGRVVVVGPEGTRKTIELKDDGSGGVIRIESDGERRVLIVSPDGKRQRVQILSVKEDDEQEESPIRYRIGVQCQDVPPALRSHLSAHVTIPDDAGILVEDVHEESPAEKAGLREHDLLIEAGGLKLTSVEALQDVIQKSGEEPITFTGFREGEPLEVEVTPKPVEKGFRVRPTVDLDMLLEDLSTAERDLLKQHLGSARALQLQRVGPSVMLNRTPMLGDVPRRVERLDAAKAIKDLSRQLKDLSERIEKLQSVVGELQTNEEEPDGR